MSDWLLCHFDGTNGSTSFTDDAGHTLTATGVTVNTTLPKFGTGEGDFTSGASARLNTGASGDFNFKAAPFTLETWAYFTSAPGSTTTVIAAQWAGSSNLGWLFGMVASQLAFYYSNTGSDTPTVGAAFTPALNTWYHLAVDRDVSHVLRVYVNGAVLASGVVSSTIFPSTTNCTLGNDGDLIHHFLGRLDEMRISNVAQYGGAFTPPSAPFTYSPFPPSAAQVTQVTVEQWVTTATITGQAMVTQVALEQWVPAGGPTVDLAGNLGAPCHYGKLKYGLKKYSRISAFAPIFAADLTIAPVVNLAGGLTPTIVLAADLDVHVNLIMLRGDLAPQINLGGALSLVVPLNSLLGSFGFTVVYGAAEMISGPLWGDDEPCPPTPWVPSDPCPVPPWMAAAACDQVVWNKTRLCNG